MKKNGRGRPQLPARKRRSHILSVRLCDADMRALAKASRRNGTSYSQEVQRRLTKSFYDEGIRR